MSTPADRIRWLAELSAERRAQRARLVRAAAIGKTHEYRPKVGKCPRKRRLAEALAVLQDGLCYLCGRAFRAMKLTPTIEHVVPRAKGGWNSENRLAACGPCNGAKAQRAPYPCEMIYLEAINARRTSRSAGRSARPSAEGCAAPP